MSSDWKKVITSGSIAEFESLLAADGITISGSQIIIKGLPTSDPQELGKLWNDTSNGKSKLAISQGGPSDGIG